MRAFPLTAAVLCLLSGLAWSEEEKASDPEATETASEDIETTFERQQSLREASLWSYEPEWLGQWREKREAQLEKWGLEFNISYDSLAMAGLGGGDSHFAGSGEVSLTGRWRVFGEERDIPFDLRARVRNRHAYGGRSPSALGEDMGAIWGVVDGFSDQGFEIPEFYFRQQFLDRNLEFRYGQLNLESQLDKHALRGARQAFLNRAFSTNPAVAFPRFGAGFTAKWEHESGLDLTGGVTTVQATKTGDQVDFDVGSGELFKAFQVGYDFKGWNDDPARFQVLGWHSDAIEDQALPEGGGFATTFEQQLKDVEARFFLRYSWSDGETTDAKHVLATGFGQNCRDFDLFGAAVGLGQASDSSKDWQAVFEVFYRWQVAAEMHVTPDLQILVGEGFKGGGDLRVVPGIRAQISF